MSLKIENWNVKCVFHEKMKKCVFHEKMCLSWNPHKVQFVMSGTQATQLFNVTILRNYLYVIYT